MHFAPGLSGINGLILWTAEEDGSHTGVALGAHFLIRVLSLVLTEPLTKF